MTSFEFQGALYRNKREVAAAIATAWIEAGGLNTSEDVRQILASTTDENLADECIFGWDLHDEWLDERELTRNDIIKAFTEYRETLS